MIRKIRSLGIILLLLIIFLSMTGCLSLNEEKSLGTQQTVETMNKLLNELDEKIDTIFKLQEAIRNTDKELQLSKDSISKLEQENERLNKQLIEANEYNISLDNDYKQLTNEFQNTYFDICTQVEHSLCSQELQYFDPRVIKAGDKLFGLTVISVTVGEYGPDSYILSLRGTASVKGKYTYIKGDAERGNYYRFETSKINDLERELEFSIGLKSKEYQSLKEVFTDDTGTASILIKNITLKRLPHQPGYNSAEFVGMAE